MPFLLGLISLGSMVIVASIIYQTFKPGSQGPAVVNTLAGTGYGIVTQLFK